MQTLNSKQLFSITNETYNNWLAKEIELAINDPRPNISHKQAMEILDAEIAAIEKQHAAHQAS